MQFQDILDSIPLLATVGAAVIGASYAYHLSYSSSKKAKERPDNKPPQTTDLTWKDMRDIFAATTGPADMLQYVRKSGLKIFESQRFPFAPPLYIISDYKTARKVLEDKESKKWDPGNVLFKRTMNGTNVIIAEGHRWKHVKKSTSTAFSAANVKLMVEQIDVIVDEWMKTVLEPAAMSDGSTAISILDELNNVTASVIGKVAFDFEFTEEERSQFLEDLLTCWVEFGVKTQTNMLMVIPLTAPFYSGIRKAQRAANRMFTFSGKILNEYRAKSDTEKKPHKLIHMIAEDVEYKDDAERQRDLVAYTIAGFDTTANTISFALRELAMKPEEQHKLRSALRACSSPNEARSCPELKMVVKEILRMYPAAAHGSVRQVFRDIPIPDQPGKIIPKGSIVNSNYYVMQRDEEMYEDPDTFKPSRWENPTREQIASLMTFSYGKRSCQGQALANAEMYEILYKLCLNYHFHIVEPGEPQSVVLFKPVGTLLSLKKVSP